MQRTLSSQQAVITGVGPRDVVGLGDRTIHVCGPRSFQNQLLTHFMEQKTGARCHPVERISDIPVPGRLQGDPRHQILVDCLGKGVSEIVATLETDGRDLLTEHLLALFNVSPGEGIEERTVTMGVRGFFYESDSLDLFLKGVQAIFMGELWLSRGLMSRYILKKGIAHWSGAGGEILTPRENEILALVVVGSSNDEIAEKLCISPHTVKTHIYNIFKKIDVPNRFQAALWAAKNL